MNTQRLTRQTDSTVVMPRPARPVSFAGLMTLYESNYVRLGWLLDDMPPLHASLVSCSRTDMPLYLHVEEVCRYTTTLLLTYLFQDRNGLLQDPGLRVRVYHDAHMVEAMACTTQHRHRALKPFVTSSGTELQQRWARNMMLNKWLEFCADQGHVFPSPTMS